MRMKDTKREQNEKEEREEQIELVTSCNYLYDFIYFPRERKSQL